MDLTTFREENFRGLCDRVCEADADLATVIRRFGYPPMWSRPAGFATLVHIILEQQVSLASARAALAKLKETVVAITPEAIVQLGEEGLKKCWFSRQKASYVMQLAEGMVRGAINLERIGEQSDESAKATLISLKGIGNWTAEIYLLMALRRTDIFPTGDLAMASTLKRLKSLPREAPAPQLLEIADAWRPYRSLATMILWHEYLESKK